MVPASGPSQPPESPSSIRSRIKKKSKRPPSKMLPFEEARTFVRKLNLKSCKAWEAWRKSRQRPSNIPSRPDTAYREYISLPDWLGGLVRGADDAGDGGGGVWTVCRRPPRRRRRRRPKMP